MPSLSITDIFRFPTLSGLAGHLTPDGSCRRDSIRRRSCTRGDYVETTSDAGKSQGKGAVSDEAHSNALVLASPLVAGPVSLASTDPTIELPVYPEEIAAVSNAVPKRVSEFTAGRVAARLALKQLGAPAMSVPMAPDRSPIWPPGLTGSITHTHSACLAAVAWEREVRMLGSRPGTGRRAGKRAFPPRSAANRSRFGCKTRQIPAKWRN